jgi:hypothetical protein
MMEQNIQTEVVDIWVVMVVTRSRRATKTTGDSNGSARQALQRLSIIASALSHYKKKYSYNVSACGDVDACSRASQACRNVR